MRRKGRKPRYLREPEVARALGCTEFEANRWLKHHGDQLGDGWGITAAALGRHLVLDFRSRARRGRGDAGAGFPTRLAALREGAGLQLFELARRADVSIGYLSQLEGGSRATPGGHVVARLADALGVDVDYLWTGACP